MDKYMKTLVFDYVNGNDIKDYTIEELESNPKFMLEVILYTDDYRMYDLCDHVVKVDYDFVSTLITKYKKNAQFISSIATYFINNTSDEFKKREICILIDNETKSSTNELLVPFKVSAYSFYLTNCVMFEKVLQSERLKKNKNKYEKGFILANIEFKESSIIRDYFADKMLKEIFDEEIDLEKSIHNKFEKYEDLEKYGINRFLIDIINKYDVNLCDYLIINRDLLKDIYKSLDKIKLNWKEYEYHFDIELIEKIIDEVFEYQLYYFNELPININSLINYVMINTNLIKKFEIYEENYNYLDCDELEHLDINKTTSRQKELISILLERVDNIIKGIDNPNYTESNNLIKLDFKNKKVI